MKNSNIKNQKGFSLIELLIVVVIIGIIAAIAIPNLLAARRAANEGSAQSTTRTLHSANVTYSATTGNGAYGTLAQMKTAGLIDAQVADQTNGKSGYKFDAQPNVVGSAVPAGFAASAIPTGATAGVSQTGTRRFCMALDGVFYAYTNTLSTSPITAATSSVPTICATPTAGSGGIIQ